MMVLMRETNPFHSKALCSLVLIILFQPADGKAQEDVFFRDSLCDLSARQASGCSTKVPKISSKIECLLICIQESLCTGVSFGDNGVCFKHQKCSSISSCAKNDDNHVHLFKGRCKHGGKWKSSNGRCQCEDGWVGSLCQEYAKDCDELVSYGYRKGAQHRAVLDIDNNLKTLIPVQCWITGKGSTSMQLLRNPGNIDFNLTWAEYRDGFDDDKTESWITGLKWVNVLTQRGYRSLTLNIDIQGWGAFSRTYRGFLLSDEAAGFSYTFDEDIGLTRKVDGKKMTMGDCFGPNQNTPFSSWDHDNDGVVKQNCASRAGSGWWYKDCRNQCNVLGWGPNFTDTKPSHQMMSVLGFDLEPLGGQRIKTRMHLYR